MKENQQDENNVDQRRGVDRFLDLFFGISDSLSHVVCKGVETCRRERLSNRLRQVNQSFCAAAKDG